MRSTGCAWRLRLCQRCAKAKAVQASSFIIRPATKNRGSDRRGVRARASPDEQRTNASKLQGVLIRPQCSSARGTGDVRCSVVR